ncbi:hypothetical protein DER29_5995 [Micromonospora sp. M71_S20]|uniref:hypothetical protein n=1 Tax=Micromonospora sp. M71_S20 TaxID=592872 RepID=UPI000EAEA857|nr:hypothetical protein [Micromonospora sp. M71_S20]RLK09494.1 hypothetical protein DER29_5995 [Micromonospora sp. M71_S20]
MTGDDTSLWLLTDLATCTTCWQTLQPYAATPRRRFYVCFCFTLYNAEHLEALVVGHAAAHDRRTATERPLITYYRWHQATRADLRQHLVRMVDQVLVHTPHAVDLRWHTHVPTATAAYQP